MSADPVAFLTAALARAEDTAKGISVARWMNAAMDMRASMQADFLNVLDPGLVGPYFELTAPEAVLRCVAADRQILAMWQDPEHVRHLPGGVHDGRDPEEGEVQVAAAEAIDLVVRLLAEAWGWTEETT